MNKKYWRSKKRREIKFSFSKMYIISGYLSFKTIK